MASIDICTLIISYVFPLTDILFKTALFPFLISLAFQKPAEQLQVFLVTAFPVPSAMDKNGVLLFADLFQKLTDLLKFLCPCFLHYRKFLQILLIQERYGFLYFLEHFCFPFPYGFFQTKVYLLADASSFVPEIKTVSFDNSPAFSSRFAI